MSEPSFAQTMLSKIEALLAQNPGVQQINVDGVTVQFADLLKQRDHWRREVQQELGKRSALLDVDLGGF